MLSRATSAAGEMFLRFKTASVKTNPGSLAQDFVTN